ncbi:hypothetical protein BH24GEM2_BH24GEM2_10560 [soil metagenome]
MIRVLVVGALLSVAALTAERVAGWFDWPRRWIWAATMILSLLVPALALWIPAWLPSLDLVANMVQPARGANAAGIEWLWNARETGIKEVGGPNVGGADDDRLAYLLCMIWFALSSLVSVGTALSYARLRALRKGCTPADVDGATVLIAERIGPAVLGLLHPAVVIPRRILDAPAEERELVLLHEREHITSGDGWLLALALVAVALMPWNVWLWWQHRRLRLALETDCDARVLARGASRRTYGRVLLSTAQSNSRLSLLSPALGERMSHLERRIHAMTTKHPKHRLLRSLPLMGISFGVVLAACDTARPGESTLATGPVAERTTAGTTPDGASWSATDQADGTMLIKVGPTPSAVPRGTLGFWHTYHFSTPMRVYPGETPPSRMQNHPVVKNLQTGSNAAKAGIAEGDTILAVNGRDGREGGHFKDRTPGTTYTLRVRRGGAEREISFEVGPP